MTYRKAKDPVHASHTLKIVDCTPKCNGTFTADLAELNPEQDYIVSVQAESEKGWGTHVEVTVHIPATISPSTLFPSTSSLNPSVSMTTTSSGTESTTTAILSTRKVKLKHLTYSIFCNILNIYD